MWSTASELDLSALVQFLLGSNVKTPFLQTLTPELIIYRPVILCSRTAQKRLLRRLELTHSTRARVQSLGLVLER